MDTSSFTSWNKTHVHINGFALGLGLKRRFRVTRKWAVKIYYLRGLASGSYNKTSVRYPNHTRKRYHLKKHLLPRVRWWTNDIFQCPMIIYALLHLISNTKYEWKFPFLQNTKWVCAQYFLLLAFMSFNNSKWGWIAETGQNWDRTVSLILVKKSASYFFFNI